jgi:parallel beta-helix repeat protein
MSARTVPAVLALVISALFIASALGAGYSSPPSTGTPSAVDESAPLFALGGPTPTVGAPVCPGSTAYTAAQIVILPSGAVYPTGAPVSESGNVYTLEDPVDTSLLVMASNAIIDGSNCPISYALTGGNGNGTAVAVVDASNLTVEYVDLAGISGTGIWVQLSSAVTVYGSSLQTAAGVGPVYGIEVQSSEDVNVTTNNASFDSYGVVSFNSVGVTIYDNQVFEATEYPVYAKASSQVQIVDNYAPRAGNIGVFFDASQDALVEGNNLSANLNGASVGAAVEADFGAQYTIDRNNLSGTQEYGVYLDSSGNATISHNDVTGGIAEGILAYDCYYGAEVTVSDNDIQNTTADGVYDDGSGSMNISGNDLSVASPADGTTGVNASDSYGTTYIQHNRMTGGLKVGIWFDGISGTAYVLGNDVQNVTFIGVDDSGTAGLVVGGNDLSVNATGGLAAIWDTYEEGGLSVTGNALSGGWEYGLYIYEAIDPISVSDNIITNLTGDGIVIDDYTTGTLSVSGNEISPNASVSTVIGVYVDYSYAAVNISNNVMTGGLVYGFYAYYLFGPTSLFHNRITNTTGVAINVEDYASADLDIAYNDLSVNTSANDVYGIYVAYVYDDLTVVGNVAAGGVYDGLETYGASGFMDISDNMFANATYEGIYADGASGGLTLTDNDVAANASSSLDDPVGLYVDDNGGGTVLVSGNNATGGLYYGIEAEDNWGPVNWFLGNDLRGATDAGIYDDFDYTPTVIENNDLMGSPGYGIQLYEPNNVTVEGNALQHSNDSIYASYAYGPTLIEDNNASYSNVSLELTEFYDGMYYVDANDFSHSNSTYVSDVLVSMIGNDFRDTPLLEIGTSDLLDFYHNDVDTSPGATLNLTGTVPLREDFNAPLPIGGNYWTGYVPTSCDYVCTPAYSVPSVSGPSGYYDEYPLGEAWTNYAVTFTETGLPADTAWTVTFDGSVVSAVAPASISFFPQNVQPVSYSYSVPAVGAYTLVSPSSGSVTAEGSTIVVSVSFAVPTYAVNFTEYGLPTGAIWYVNSTGSPAFTSQAFSVTSSSSQTFLLATLADGTYPFEVQINSPDYLASTPASGSFVVSGANVSVAYTYLPVTYDATFSESGLPSGASWTITVGGTAYPGTGSTIVIALMNGSYPYSIAVPSGYTALPATSSLTVNGGAVSVYVAVSAKSVPSTSSGPSNSELYALGAGLAIAAVAAVIGWLLYLGRRGGSASTTPASGAPPPSTSGAAAPGEWNEGPPPSG